MLDILKELFTSYGGWWILFTVVCFAVVWVIRKTKTDKDDKILDEYVAVAINYALKIMPKDSKIDWVKLVANALGKFNEVYTKTNDMPPDASLYEKAKAVIEKVAELKQIEQLKKNTEDNQDS